MTEVEQCPRCGEEYVNVYDVDKCPVCNHCIKCDNGQAMEYE